ncbi:hypothetical protein CCU68_33090 [Pseudomonas gingeri NCPPB 3146 = LMG 5327]|uniref:Uncharacterized protein n=2 Tax=Pseudomonas gingeri TaxID=117681 RepID=A0ABX4XVI8_9PSED|nr:hypothetical protein CCU68_33090 [Pseudomonas gingeri NCPPB 3146 = LMG 5327]
MDGWINGNKHEASTGAQAPGVVSSRPSITVPSLVALPSELAFWALWHCRHARPPDPRHSR